jgi:hypothetical protein
MATIVIVLVQPLGVADKVLVITAKLALTFAISVSTLSVQSVQATTKGIVRQHSVTAPLARFRAQGPVPVFRRMYERGTMRIFCARLVTLGARPVMMVAFPHSRTARIVMIPHTSRSTSLGRTHSAQKSAQQGLQLEINQPVRK